MQKVKVKEVKTHLAVPDRNSSWDSHMAMKWSTTLDVA